MSPISSSPAVDFTVGIALVGAGWHPAAWREPEVSPAELFRASYWQSLIAEAEVAGIDYVTIEDSLQLPSQSAFDGAVPPRPRADFVDARLDALLITSWAAARTDRIGLIPTVTTTHTEPFHVATALQTLDHISLGRAGWQLRFSAGAAEAAAFGRKAAPNVDLDAVIDGRPDAGLDELIGEAADFAEVARRLWDSWEDDAIIRDVSSGRFLDRDRLHHIDFEGDRFSVAGPSIVPRSPQGQLPITLLAHSPSIFDLAARSADVVFITPENDSVAAGASRGKSVAQLVAEVRAAEEQAGRAERGLAPLRIVADLVVAIDSDSETGSSRLERLNDLSGSGFTSDARLAVGSAEEIVELIASSHAAGAAGVRLRPLSLPGDLRAISERLLPLLRADLPTSPVEAGAQLRARFNLPASNNRYTVEREEQAA